MNLRLTPLATRVRLSACTRTGAGTTIGLGARAPQASVSASSVNSQQFASYKTHAWSMPSSSSSSISTSIFTKFGLVAFAAILTIYIGSETSSAEEETSNQGPASVKGESDENLPRSWWEAPTVAGKTLLLLEQTYNVLTDTRDVVSESWTALRQWLSESSAYLRYRITHKHAPIHIPYYLLPEPLPPGFQKPITLVVDLNLLFAVPPHRIKRAGFDFFLTQVSDFAEIVVISDQRHRGVFDLFATLDPLGLIAFRLSLEHFWVTDRRMDKRFLTTPPRDLSRLRRDPRHLVVMTEEPERYVRHPENVLFVDSNNWRFNPHDTELFELVTVLAHLSQQKDVRPELQRYDGVNVAALARLVARESREESLKDGGAIELEEGE